MTADQTSGGHLKSAQCSASSKDHLSPSSTDFWCPSAAQESALGELSVFQCSWIDKVVCPSRCLSPQKTHIYVGMHISWWAFLRLCFKYGVAYGCRPVTACYQPVQVHIGVLQAGGGSPPSSLHQTSQRLQSAACWEPNCAAKWDSPMRVPHGDSLALW